MAGIKQIESNIINGFQLAPKGTSGVIFAQKPFLNPGISVSQSDLKSIYDISDESPQQKVWEVICDSIIKWIGGVALNPALDPFSVQTAHLQELQIL